MDMIRGFNDLGYVNRKLIESRFNQTKVGVVKPRHGRVVSQTAVFPNPISLDVHHTDDDDKNGSDNPEEPSPTLSVPLRLISPDSEIPCVSSECPLRKVPHKEGRYFHNGEPATHPIDSNTGIIIRGSVEDISNTFNRTVPPPAIVTAYLRICAGSNNNDDLKMVRQYQKHHMWSPIVTEPVTPYPREVFPEMHGLYGQDTTDERRVLTFDQLCSSDHDAVTRPIQASDFEDSEDEIEMTSPRPIVGESEGPQPRSPHAESRKVKDPSANDEVSLRSEASKDRRISDKFDIQQRILYQTAVHQRMSPIQQKEKYRRSVAVCAPCTNEDDEDNEDDISLEILLELSEILPKAVKDGGFRKVFHDTRYKNTGLSKSEISVLHDAQIMLNKVFADLVSAATRPYQPSGLPVTPEQLRNELLSVISRRQYMLRICPGKTIADIVSDLSRKGKDLFSI